MVLPRVVHQLVRTVVLVERGIKLMVGCGASLMLLDSIVEDVLGPQGVRMGHAIMDRPRVKRVVLHAAEVLAATNVLGAPKMLNMAAATEPADRGATKMAAADVASCPPVTAPSEMANSHLATTHMTAADVATTHVTTTKVPPASHMATATTSVAVAGFQTRNAREGQADADGNCDARGADHG